MGVEIAHEKGELWGKVGDIVKYSNCLTGAVQKQINRWIYRSGSAKRQTVGLIKIQLGTELCLTLGDIVLHRHLATHMESGTAPPPLAFLATLL